MRPVKRIEIITDEQEMHKILEHFDKIGVSGYTVIHNVTGKSSRGNAADDLPITGLGNVYVLGFCSADLIDLIIKDIRPIINKFGGVFYVSDAMEVKSIHCEA